MCELVDQFYNIVIIASFFFYIFKYLSFDLCRGCVAINSSNHFDRNDFASLLTTTFKCATESSITEVTYNTILLILTTLKNLVDAPLKVSSVFGAVDAST